MAIKYLSDFRKHVITTGEQLISNRYDREKTSIPAFAGMTVIGFLLCLTPAVGASLHEVREVHYQMGTFLAFTIWDANENAARRLIRQAVVEVHRLETVLSNYDQDSDLSRFNRHAGRGRMKLDLDLYAVLKTAVAFSAETGGSFDITVGPLIDLWKDSLERNTLPSRKQVATAAELVGYRKLKLLDGMEAEMPRGMNIDLGGIAKGYALDRVGEIFKAAGVGTALINFGGSSAYAIGAPPENSGWQIAIKGPQESLRGSILLRDAALSTSGTMGRYWTVAGKKYGHIIDPRLGEPVTEPRVATVIAKSATAAEALSKPLVISGPSALAVIGRMRGSEAGFFPDHGSPHFTPGFRRTLQWRELPAT